MCLWVDYLFVVLTDIYVSYNYYTIADLYNLQSFDTDLLSLFPLVFTIRFLATDK
jgi:hypothetical protein